MFKTFPWKRTIFDLVSSYEVGSQSNDILSSMAAKWPMFLFLNTSPFHPIMCERWEILADYRWVCDHDKVVTHDDVIKWKHFPHYWPFVGGIHRSPVNSPHKGQWRGASMFSLICPWINGSVNNREAGDLRCHRTHYDVIVMKSKHHRASWHCHKTCGICITATVRPVLSQDVNCTDVMGEHR